MEPGQQLLGENGKKRESLTGIGNGILLIRVNCLHKMHVQGVKDPPEG